MKSIEAEDLLNKIEQTIQNISSFTNTSPQEASYFAKFLVVFICGIYEETIEVIINERISRLNSHEVSKFIRNSVRWSFRNPKIDNIKKLLERFDDSWEKSMDRISSKAKTALNSIVDNKNALAHGDPCNVTLSDVIEFYQNSRPIIEEIDKVIL